MARSVSESMPLNNWPIIDWKLIGVNAVATSTPAMIANATGTPQIASAVPIKVAIALRSKSLSYGEALALPNAQL